MLCRQWVGTSFSCFAHNPVGSLFIWSIQTRGGSDPPPRSRSLSPPVQATDIWLSQSAGPKSLPRNQPKTPFGHLGGKNVKNAKKFWHKASEGKIDLLGGGVRPKSGRLKAYPKKNQRFPLASIHVGRGGVFQENKDLAPNGMTMANQTVFHWGMAYSRHMREACFPQGRSHPRQS